jgi:hypothetical protein
VGYLEDHLSNIACRGDREQSRRRIRFAGVRALNSTQATTLVVHNTGITPVARFVFQMPQALVRRSRKRRSRFSCKLVQNDQCRSSCALALQPCHGSGPVRTCLAAPRASRKGSSTTSMQILSRMAITKPKMATVESVMKKDRQSRTYSGFHQPA